MKYNRNDINDCITKALQLARLHNITFYIYAIAYGFVISKLLAPSTQEMYIITPEGVKLESKDFRVSHLIKLSKN